MLRSGLRFSLIFLLSLVSLSSPLSCDDGIIRGVNLGGWLLLEPWITPVFFEEVNLGDLQDQIVDEWTYAERLDPQVYQERMVGHWSTFLTPADLEDLVRAGVSYVRIPVGYWYWDVQPDEPFPAPNLEEESESSPLFYLRRALTWMEELGLKALIDLHAAPGSQNGYDNSGRRGKAHWVDASYLLGNRLNLDRTVAINNKIASTIRRWVDTGLVSLNTIYGFGLLNEPHICGYQSLNLLKDACLQDYYPKGYAAIREHFSPEEAAVVIDVAGLAFEQFAGRFPEAEYQNLLIDAHHYQCFENLAGYPATWETHLQEACRIQEDISKSPLPVITGEFSMAVTDCQKYLQGGYTTPYDPVTNNETCQYYNGDFDNYQADHKDFLRSFFISQLDSYEAGERGAGWFMWTMKVEDEAGPEWDFLYMWRQGIIPANLCNRDHHCH